MDQDPAWKRIRNSWCYAAASLSAAPASNGVFLILDVKILYFGPANLLSRHIINKCSFIMVQLGEESLPAIERFLLKKADYAIVFQSFICVLITSNLM